MVTGGNHQPGNLRPPCIESGAVHSPLLSGHVQTYGFRVLNSGLGLASRPFTSNLPSFSVPHLPLASAPQTFPSIPRLPCLAPFHSSPQRDSCLLLRSGLLPPSPGKLPGMLT